MPTDPPGIHDRVNGLALTFDDGPDAVWTSRLLDLLGDRGAQVTFFPIAARAAAQPELIERMQADGHTVGLHCHAHVRHSHRDEAWLRSDTREALALLSSVGVTPCLWRTPWGDRAPWSAAVAGEHGLELIGWSVDTHDWRGDDAEEMFAVTRSGLVPSAVILAHDGIGPGALRQTPEQTLAYVEQVAEFAVSRGFPLESLGIGAPA